MSNFNSKNLTSFIGKSTLPIAQHKAKAKDDIPLSDTSNQDTFQASNTVPNEPKLIPQTEKKAAGSWIAGFLEKKFPARKKAIDNLTRHSSDESRDLHIKLLSDTAIGSIYQGPKDLVARTVENLDKQDPGSTTLATELRYIMVKEAAEADPRVKLMVGIADSVGSDGNPKIKNENTIETLHLGGIESEAPDRDLLRETLKNCHESDRSYVARALGAGLFPELNDRVDDIIGLSPVRDNNQVRDLLFRAAFDSPKETNPDILVQKAADYLTDSESDKMLGEQLYQARLQKLGFGDTATPTATEIETEEDYLLVGDQILEVDLG